jgi:hypothetical protein
MTHLLRRARFGLPGTLATVFAALAVGAGCSLLTDFDALDAQGALDASTGAAEAGPAGDASTADASGDEAPPNDASTGSDGGACPATAFCDDFERIDVLGKWTRTSSDDGGTVEIEGVPGARHLKSSIVGRDGGGAPFAVLRKELAGIVTRVSVECDLSYDRRPVFQNDGNILLVVIIDNGANKFQLIYLDVKRDQSAFVLQDPTAAVQTIDFRPVAFEPGLHHIAIDMSIGGRTRLRVDGPTLLDIPTPAFMQSGTPALELGVSGPADPSSSITLTADNVVFSAD